MRKLAVPVFPGIVLIAGQEICVVEPSEIKLEWG